MKSLRNRNSVFLKTEDEIDMMRESCKIVAEVIKIVGMYIKPGIATQRLDNIAEDFIRSYNASPAFKGYGFEDNNLFPATLCISIDNEVVHGIPNQRVLKEGEIVSIDVGVKKNGYYGDGAYTFAVGKISNEKEKLLKVTEEALYKGIEKAIVGNRLGDISCTVQNYVEEAGFSVVRDLVGHGIGRSLHEEPSVPNYGKKGKGLDLMEGMTLAIEPMVNAGTYKVYTSSDNWTIQTDDGLPSAHFEHTIVVRKNKAEILTLS